MYWKRGFEADSLTGLCVQLRPFAIPDSVHELFPRDCIKPGIATAGLNGSSTCLRGNCGPVVSAELILAEVGVTYCKVANKRLKSTRSPNLLRRGFSILTALSACMQTGDDLDHMLSRNDEIFIIRVIDRVDHQTMTSKQLHLFTIKKRRT